MRFICICNWIARLCLSATVTALKALSIPAEHANRIKIGIIERVVRQCFGLEVDDSEYSVKNFGVGKAKTEEDVAKRGTRGEVR